MVLKTLAMTLTLACALGACTSTAPDPAPPPGEELAAAGAPPAASVERFVAPTEEMLAAARTGDPSKMQAAVALNSCPTASTCPTEFGSCTAWSAPSVCGTSCITTPICSCPIGPIDPNNPPEPCEPDLSYKLGVTHSSSFRVCFNAAQQACTEWKLSGYGVCGC